MTDPSDIKTSDLFQGIANLYSKLYDISLDETEKLKVVGILMNDLLMPTGNSPKNLFDLVPEKYLIQLLINIHMMGINVEPIFVGINLDRLENGLSVLLTLGDFADDKYVNSLIFFFSKLETKKYQAALLKIAENCIDADNYKMAKIMLHEIDLGMIEYL